MKKFKRISSDCTAIIVGKKASIDGSTIIARDEDGYGPINPIKFIAVPAQDYDETYKSKYTGLEVPVHEHGYRYTATPQGDNSNGDWFESGINEKNVAMSATETEQTNARVLGHDPLVPGSGSRPTGTRWDCRRRHGQPGLAIHQQRS